MGKNGFKRRAAWLLALSLAAAGIPAQAVQADTQESADAADEAMGGTPPDAADGTMGEPPGDMSDGTMGEPPDGASGGGANTQTFDYTGTYSGVLTASGTSVTSEGETYSTATKDQNAALAENGGTLYITGDTFTKSGDDTDGDSCNFYEVNSILLAVNSGSTAYVSDSTFSADSEGSNGIFATDGALVYVNGSTITTTADNSRGLDATYGGTIVANDLTITTSGDHCAAVANDRGGGYISVTNSALSTAGSGSPVLYSTGAIEVYNVTGTASGSQLAGMEGLNTIRIYNSSITSTITSKTASDPIANGVIIYQSTSGDADTSTGETAQFEASNSTLKSSIASGTMFYVTNVTANIVLENTTLDFDTDKAKLITAVGNDANSWGTAGKNGGIVTFTGRNQTLNGDVEVDTISSVDLYLLEGSAYTGSTAITENAVNTSPTSAPLTVSVDGTSTWVLTADSTVTNLNAAAGAAIVDADGNAVSIVVNGTKQVSGTSSLTLTVTGSYTTSVFTENAGSISAASIDRSAFDSYFGTTTVFAADGSAASVTKPTKTVIKKATALSAKKLKVKWKENASADGYQVKISTSKSFTKNVKKKLVKSASTTSTTFKNLKANKKYYVKVRAYQLVDGKKVYGAWSAVKSVKLG